MAEIQDQLHNHVEDEIDAYALGILEDDALAKVEAHLEGCEQCRRLLQQAREVTNLLLIAPTPVAPPASLKQRILSRLAQEGQQDGRSTPSAPDLSSTQDREAENRRPGSEREGRSAYEPDPTVATPLPETTSARQGWSETLRHLLTGRRGTAGGKAAGAADPAAEEHLQVVLRLLHAPNPAIWELPGTPEAPRAHARLLGSPDEDTAILLVSGLEPLPPDRDYQLWFLRENQPVGSAVFDVHRNGEGQLVIHAPRQLAHYDLAAITPEPAGGSPGPTGPIVIAGALKAA